MRNFYWRLIKRQWRLGAVKLFCVAIALACAVTFSITLLSDRLNTLFDQQSKEILAADMLLSSSFPLNEIQQTLINTSDVKKAQTVTFNSMASTQDKFLLSSVKAVSAEYPLRGQLQTANEAFGIASPNESVPSIGNAWVENRVLSELDINMGDTLFIGEKSFNVSRVLVFEPDRGNSFFSFTPRIMIHQSDLKATGIIQEGSRVKYGFLFAGDAPELKQLQTQMEITLEPSQEFVSVESSNENFAKTLKTAYEFLQVTVLLAVLLGAVAVALVSLQYANEMTYQYAVLRCLGLKGKELIVAITLPFALFSVVGIILGLLVGGGAHWLILQSLSSLLPTALPAPSMAPFLLSSLSSLVIIASFAWPFLKNLAQTPPKLLLGQQNHHQQSHSSTLVSISLGVLVLVLMTTQSLILSLGFIATIILFLGIAYWSSAFIIDTLSKYSKKMSVDARLSIRLLHANRKMAILQIIAVSLTFFSLALIQTLRDDLIDSWQTKVPENAPNFFAINIFENDVNDLKAMLQSKNIEPPPFYPIVRGRLTALNSISIHEVVTDDSQGERTANRDLSLTWSTELPKDNTILNGQWHSDIIKSSLPENTVSVSIENELAEDIGIALGDSLTFVIETQTIQAQVTSLREVNWESFTPNFYMIFDEEGLQNLPYTLIGSFYLSENDRPFVAELINRFSNASFFDVEVMLSRFRGITAQVGFAVESILYFSLAASLMIFIAIEMILHRNRMHTTAVCKALGAPVTRIQKLFRWQFVFIGIIAGALAYILNSSFSFFLTQFVMEGDYVFNLKTLLLCFFISPLLVLLAGQRSIQQAKNTSAKQLLNAGS